MSGREELERLLREPVERLAPPAGAWEAIERRARRRRWASAAASVAAVVVVVAGAVPAVIAVRDSSSDAQLAANGQFGNHTSPAPGGSETDRPAPAPTSALSGYFPESLSFVSQTEGYLWGSAGTSPAGVVARTLDGGRHWTELPAPPVDTELTAKRGAAQIRFASASVGFLFGSQDFITRDAGASWQPFAAPGYIADLEAMNQRIWALVRPSPGSHVVRLYAATAERPELRRVGGVPVMRGLPGTPEVAGAASIAVSGDHVDVIVGSSSFYSSPNGRRWVSRSNPCPSVAGAPRTTLATSTDSLGVAVACGYDVHGRAEAKQLYVSADSGHKWHPLASQPAARGLLQTLSAGSPDDLLIGTSWGGAQVTHNGGRSWAGVAPSGARLSFVGFIDINHVVAVTDPAGAATGSFATSYDSGRTWTLTHFPAAP